MRMIQGLLNVAQFIFDAFFEIFSDTDNYPAVGLQPFDGEITSH